jgi:hypothetical protein
MIIRSAFLDRGNRLRRIGGNFQLHHFQRGGTRHLKLSPCIAAIFLMILAAGCDNKPETSNSKLSIVISGDTAGWLMPCGCTSNQSGGLLRRATYLADLKKTGEVLYLDAGGAPGGASAYHREKFEAILAGEKKMGLAAHNVGKAELALGAPYLRDAANRLGVPFVCANAADAAGKAIAPALIELSAAGRKIAVIGVVSPRYATADIKITDPRQAILSVLGSGKKNDRSLVVLAYLPEDELSALASSLPEADAIIGGPTGQALSPRTVGPVLLAAATNKGKFLITLNPATGAAWTGQVVEMNASYADAPQQRDNVNDYLARLAAKDFSSADSALVDPLPPGTPADYRIAGSASCAACHAADQQAWTASRHAHAFETIKAKNFHVDSYCQSCHTTGYGLPGGFDRLSTGDQRLGVGCESCHGPSAAHVHDPKKHTPFAAADQCNRCHDHENSPKFDYAAYWPRIAHGKHTGK